jgi:hypothetical protein
VSNERLLKQVREIATHIVEVPLERRAGVGG